jgi:hypothetical protein
MVGDFRGLLNQWRNAAFDLLTLIFSGFRALADKCRNAGGFGLRLENEPATKRERHRK